MNLGTGSLSLGGRRVVGFGLGGDTSIPDPIDPEHCTITFHCDSRGQHCSSSRTCSRTQSLQGAPKVKRGLGAIPVLPNVAVGTLNPGDGFSMVVAADPMLTNTILAFFQQPNFVGPSGSGQVAISQCGWAECTVEGIYVGAAPVAIAQNYSDPTGETAAVSSFKAIPGALKLLPIELQPKTGSTVGLTNPNKNPKGYGGTTATPPATGAAATSTWTTTDTVLAVGGVGAALAAGWFLLR
jgi:hypothetical protein